MIDLNEVFLPSRMSYEHLISLTAAASALRSVQGRGYMTNIPPTAFTVALAAQHLQPSRHFRLTRRGRANVVQVASTSASRIARRDARVWALRMWKSLTVRLRGAVEPSTLLFAHLCGIYAVHLRDYLLIDGRAPPKHGTVRKACLRCQRFSRLVS
jgi:hypothetical protein